jgi:precorrin-3B synthase
LLRIVAARDGGICRIKLPGGVLQAAQAHAIAHAAGRYATGVIDITNRANLQVRGVRAGQEPALIDALLSAGLGPSNNSTVALASADDLRNLMQSPTAGRDPFALVDTSALAAEILTQMQTEPRFAALSPKFAVLLDGGERLAMLEHPHDIWLSAQDHPDGARFVLGLAGCPPLDTPDTPDTPRPLTLNRHAQPLVTVTPAQVPTLIIALLHTFLDLASADHTRMRHLLAAYPAQAVLQHAQRYVDFSLTLPPSDEPALVAWRRAKADPALRFGAHPQRVDNMWHVGGEPPLGRLDAATLRALASLSESAGSATLCMTPWQSIVLPDIATPAVPSTLARLAELGLICDPQHPLARLIACAGSTGCAKSMADTKADALRLAEQLPFPAGQATQVHLSGCARSCAAAHCAPYTLLAVAPGQYDLYRRDDVTPGFGECVAHHLTIDQAALHLERLARSPLDA